jgi:hypothetical protein
MANDGAGFKTGSSRQRKCLECHDTRLEVTGAETRDTFLGEMSLPPIPGRL